MAQSLNEYFSQHPESQTSAGFDSNYVRTDTLQEAAGSKRYIRYYASGQKQLEVLTRKGKRQGPQTRWFENGQIQAVEEFTDNHRNGQLLSYYPNGQLRRREQYKAGKQRGAECFAPDGQPQPCTEFLRYPEYPGGILQLQTTIQERTTYPPTRLRAQIQGQVKVKFIVDKTGVVQQAEVVKSADPALDAEALRVVNSLQGWQPGRLDGDPVNVEFTLPVTFSIR
ncbi:energy transducer TonB [Hymenobacter actinosclerus]|uniref:energy transducer TonB n=1 Tax=Hymenobacter actinosclerus TaxID=82805 RepID=UPI0015A5435E|nr:energy transducer TonB [Hymenobacter actinosclerus]